MVRRQPGRAACARWRVMDGRVVGVAAHSLYADGARRRGAGWRASPCHATTRPVGARAGHLRRARAQARARGAGARASRSCSRSRTRRRRRSSSARSAGRTIGRLRDLGAAGSSRRRRRRERSPRSTSRATPPPAGRTTSSATREYLALALPRLAARLQAVRSDERLRGRLAGEAAPGPRRSPCSPTSSAPTRRSCAARGARSRGRGCCSRCRRPSSARAFLAAGFLPTPQTLHLMGKALAGQLEHRPAAWRFTLGDTDFF